MYHKISYNNAQFDIMLQAGKTKVYYPCEQNYVWYHLDSC